ncbi:MAG: N-acetyltransferase [Ignavibacteriae bacterium HGW-Ignavibacteriae-2]|nr:GNAT family N-acetyltransferase [Bacteroidota bacterium]PKL89851.1 MAG: N-acetyltransferase [Ignavibacteriae bacterium HGW-Ignavibacteriae-2]
MIRKITTKDRDSLVSIINRITEFSAEEKEVAIELIDESIKEVNDNPYITFVFVLDETAIGFYCIGKRALTDGVFDLYWIVVDPRKQEKGYGKDLLLHAEKFVEKSNGRWLLIETSSKAEYKKTRNFYLRNFYTKVAEINDFYSKDDHLIIFGKYLIT